MSQRELGNADNAAARGPHRDHVGAGPVGDALVQGADAWNADNKRWEYRKGSERACVTLLDIAERAGNAGCYGAAYRGMMAQIPKFEGVSTSGACYHRSIEMGANWNTNR